MAENYKVKLKEFIKRNMKKGYPAETLKWSLIKQGYSRPIVEMVIEQAHKELADEVPVFKEKALVRQQVVEEEKPRKSWWKRLFSL